MKFSTEYGYMIKALKEYPFMEQIKQRCEVLKSSLSSSDINSWIRAQNKPTDPKVLVDMMRLEADPILHKYKLFTEAIDKAKAKLLPNEWLIIRDVYVLDTMNAEGATLKYLNASKSYGYDKVIKPFFADIERNIFAVMVDEKFSSLKISW